jgi:alpha-L-fucosidase
MSEKNDGALLSRREMLWMLAGASTLLSPIAGMAAQHGETRAYLGKFGKIHPKNGNTAALAWFQNAKFGLFMHYGLYSQLGRGEWVMLQQKIPLTQYEKLKNSFHPDGFDAGRIASVAVDAGMKYVNLTAKHHEGFCLFRTRQTNYNSTESPSRRDLVDELAQACSKRGLGLFLYYSAALDWHHPYFPDPSAGFEYYRPAYPEKPAQYLWRKDADTQIYVEYVRHQLRELLTQYGPIAGLWFDPVMGYYARPDLFPMQDIYGMIRELQPGCLISFKQGATGTEDFAAPERHPGKTGSYGSILPAHREIAREVAEKAWDRNRSKPMELCNTLQHSSWGYNRGDDGKHRAMQIYC